MVGRDLSLAIRTWFRINVSARKPRSPLDSRLRGNDGEEIGNDAGESGNDAAKAVHFRLMPSAP